MPFKPDGLNRILDLRYLDLIQDGLSHIALQDTFIIGMIMLPIFLKMRSTLIPNQQSNFKKYNVQKLECRHVVS